MVQIKYHPIKQHYYIWHCLTDHALKYHFKMTSRTHVHKLKCTNCTPIYSFNFRGKCSHFIKKIQKMDLDKSKWLLRSINCIQLVKALLQEVRLHSIVVSHANWPQAVSKTQNTRITFSQIMISALILMQKI